MNTDSHNNLAEMVHMQPGASIPRSDAPFPENGALTDLADKAARALQTLAMDGQDLSQALEARLDSLQESFMDLLNGQLTSGKVGLQERLHLYLSSEGRLVIEGDDNDAEKLCEIISRKPALQRRFRELARLALLSRGVEVARQAHAALQDPEDSFENPLFSRYHMCLKGPLSHFYVR